MKVRDAIEALQGLDPEAELIVEDGLNGDPKSVTSFSYIPETDDERIAFVRVETDE